MTAMEKSHRPWKGETGPINKDMLDKCVKGAGGPIYYLAGPPAMVAGLHSMLNLVGIDDDEIRLEEFGGC